MASGDRNTSQVFRFGPFELDPRAGELRKHGIRIRLQEQPLKILTMLLVHPGEAVLREEIQRALWPNDTVVEFNLGINAAIKRLRTALGDSADEPRYVETLARRGYRFIGELEAGGLKEPAGENEFTGKTIGHYRVLEKLGSGGMGVVYRAEDLRLGRMVAIKFLHCASSEAAAEMLERFRREARAAAVLNHPHICTVHAMEEMAGQPMIVMELLEGETLAERLAKGRLSFEETVKLGIQLAQALDAGHRAGIVHCDFKPGNVMLTAAGAKVLDFGLARIATENATGDAGIAGTPSYMAPEQVAGEEVDARSDIFAFGAVLYEMAAGRKAFDGDTQASLFAAIRERQPAPISSLRPRTPPAFERLVNACLAKDPLARRQSLHDLALDLEWIGKDTPVAAVRARRGLPWGAGAVAVLLAVGILLLSSGGSNRRAASPGQLHFLLDPPKGMGFAGRPAGNGLALQFAVSPDGSKVVAVVQGPERSRSLWVRSLSSATDQILPDTEGAANPFWSADSKRIGYFAHERLKTIAISGGSSQTHSIAMSGSGGTWNADGTILYAPNNDKELFRWPAAAGSHGPVTQLADRDDGHWAPHFLPDGRHFLFSVNRSSNVGIFLGSLDSPNRQFLLHAGADTIFASPDHLLFAREGKLMAQRLDVTRGRLVGDAIPIAWDGNPIGEFSTSDNGILVYRSVTGRPPNRLLWRGRDGQLLGSASNGGGYRQVFLSPDEKLAAVNGGLSVLRLDTKVVQRVIFGAEFVSNGFWSPDSRRLVYQAGSAKRRTLMTVTLGEDSPKVLFEDGNLNYPDDWSPDGKWILFRRASTKVFIIPADGSSKPVLLLDSPYQKDQFQFSPDGQWVAYNSMESGRWEVYLARFPSVTGKRQVSDSGGCQPIWRKDGRELFYLTEDGKLVSVPLEKGSTLEAGAPRVLFGSSISVACNMSQYAVAANGQKFLMIEPGPESDGSREPLHVLVNWSAGLK